MAVDWLKIKTEYINGNISLRKLAEENAVSYSRMAKVAAADQWKAQREQQRIKIESKVNQKAADKIGDAVSDEAAARLRIRSLLFRRLLDWVESADRIRSTSDFRNIVKCYKILCSIENVEQFGVEDDGLLEALQYTAGTLFADGDDSWMLPDDEENE